jgi:hypothetical protein
VAKIDDSLVERHALREKILTALCQHLEKTQPQTGETLERLKRRLMRTSSKAPELLLDIMLTERKAESNLALLLLEQIESAAVKRRLQELLRDPKLTERQRAKLATLKALQEEQEEETIGKLGLHDGVIGNLLEITELVWSHLEDEEIGLLWLEDYFHLPIEEKWGLVRFFLERGKRFYLPIISLELTTHDTEGIKYILEKLRNFVYPETVALLEKWIEHSDVAVRFCAQSVLARVRKALRKQQQEVSARPKYFFYKAFVGEDALAGEFGVVYAVRSDTGRIKFCSVLIDSWDRGITDCWGDVGKKPKEFESTVRALDKKIEQFSYQEVDGNYGLYLMHEGVRLAERRGYPLPNEFRVWQPLIEQQPYRPRNYGITFGLECLQCGKWIRFEHEKESVWVFGQVALCASCVSQKSQCEQCGSPLIVTESYALVSPSSDHVDVICKRCFSRMKRRKAQPRR